MAHVRVDVGACAVFAVPRDETREIRTERGPMRNAARWPARERPAAVAARTQKPPPARAPQSPSPARRRKLLRSALSTKNCCSTGTLYDLRTCVQFASESTRCRANLSSFEDHSARSSAARTTRNYTSRYWIWRWKYWVEVEEVEELQWRRS